MTIDARQKLIVGIVGSIIVSGISLVATLFWLLPEYHKLRSSIDDKRSLMTISQQRQANLTRLNADISDITKQQSDFDERLWLFIKEDDFFSTLELLGEKNNCQVEGLNIADATPDGTIIKRTLTLTFQGKLTDIMNALQDVQRLKQLVFITQTDLRKAKNSADPEVEITATTLWK